MKTWKLFFFILLVVIIFGVGCFAYFDKLRFDNLLSYFVAASPCQKPIEYSLGAFDDRFGESRQEFLANIEKAEKIWEDAAGKELFLSGEDGGLEINLIYDYRQAATDKLQKIGLVINDDKETYTTLKTKYDSFSFSYKQEIKAFEARIANLEAMKASYEEKVDYWNNRGGAPKDEYALLEAQKLAINEEIKAANQKQAELNDKTDTINSLATVINQLILGLNLNVDKYNSTTEETGEEFNEGVYISDASGQKINIYQFGDEKKLVRVLAHELGHALGLEHVSDPKAIMYKLNQSENEKPTASDVAELYRVCNLKK